MQCRRVFINAVVVEARIPTALAVGNVKEVICDQYGGVVSRYYNTSKDVSTLKKMGKNWEYDEEYGNLCPECLKKLRKEAQ